MSLLLDPKATISIDVAYYDNKEKQAFEKWSNATQIDAVAGQTIQVPVAEFLAYFLIHKKELSPTRYPDLDSIKRNLAKGSNDLEEWTSYDGTTLHVCGDCDSLESTFSEHLGEAGGLVVANRIHNLNEADWTKIPEISGRNGRKTLDWGYASDGTNFIEMEAKGAFCDRVDQLSELSNHKASIKDKKADSAKKCHPRFNQQALRYGTITSISKDPDSMLTVRLVDPEGGRPDRTPHDARVLKRLAWASWVVRVIAGRTHLSVALQNRIAALLQSEEIAYYDELSLRGGTGKSMPGKQFVDRFFVNRTRVPDLQAAGVLAPFDKNHLLFFGLSRQWFLPLVRQRFSEISMLKFEAGSKRTQVDCVVTPHQLDSESWNLDAKDMRREGNHLHFQRSGVLHQSLAGMVFGLVSKHEE